jgi:hypothetical protein|uniref:Replisome organizer n=1 Tax=Myoviridae sp. ctsip2 TaxID=2826705 RepID=A0A8S5N5D1_9CAUD|nr:MAG TPA: replisome organizer [Myoviridae sp. ctsip2]
MDEQIGGGYILLARNIIESQIWLKPPEYLKIWIYILFQVNFHNTKNLPRGTGFFNFRQEKIPGVTLNQVYEFLRWAKTLHPTDLTTQITTKKTTRGIILKVNNYGKYQDSKNYCHQHEKQHRNQQTTNTITVKKERNNSNTSYINVSLSIEEREILEKYLLKQKRKTPIEDIDAYIRALAKNGDLVNKLEKAKQWQERQKKKEEQAKEKKKEQKLGQGIKPDEVDSEIVRLWREKARKRL